MIVHGPRWMANTCTSHDGMPYEARLVFYFPCHPEHAVILVRPAGDKTVEWTGVPCPEPKCNTTYTVEDTGAASKT